MINNDGIMISSVADEQKRLEELRQLNLLYTNPEEEFDRITALAARIFKVPICLVSLITEDQQWFKSCIGLPEPLQDTRSTEREAAFCQFVVATKEPLIVNDSYLDNRFADNRLVHEFQIRFYAGYPLVTQSGNILGSLCIIDTKPRDFTSDELDTLKELSKWVMSEITLRHQIALYEEIQNDLILKNQQNQWLQTALENTSTAVSIVDVRGNELPIIYCNKALSRLYQMDLNELNHLPYLKFRERFNNPEVLEELIRGIRSGTLFSLELCNERDGRLFWTSLNISPVRSENGNILYSAIVETDITGERLLLQAIEEKFNEQRNILNSIPDLFYVTDPHGNLVRWNKAFNNFIGNQSDDLKGLPVKDLILESDSGLYEETIKSVFQKGSADVEITFQYKKTCLPLHLSATLYQDQDGKVLGMACVGKDISDRIQLRKDVTYAAAIQQSFLPLPFRNEHLEIKTYYKPQNFISGDFFDYRWRGNTLVGYLIDLMGHGLATALQLSALRILIQQADESEGTLVEKLKVINQSLIPYFQDGFYATAIAFSLDFDKNLLTYASAGINHFFHNQQVIEVPGSFLGTFPDLEIDEHQLSFNKKDQFIFCTDGFYDSFSHFSREWLDHRLANIENAVQSCETDDVTVLVLNLA